MGEVRLAYERVAMLNIGTVAVPDFTLMGTGFNTLGESLNPDVSVKQYISDENASKTLRAYAPEWGFDADVIDDDGTIDYIRAMAATNALGADAESEIVLYDLWDVDEGDGTVAAVKYSVVIAVDTGGSMTGGEELELSGTIHADGDPVAGTYDTTDDSFTEAS